MDYLDKLSAILKSQCIKETVERFSSLKNGDKLQLRSLDDLLKKYCRCGFAPGMEKYRSNFENFEFNIENWDTDGYTCIYGYTWSLDMFEYAKGKYEVELI